jgi:hypothetical protein
VVYLNICLKISGPETNEGSKLLTILRNTELHDLSPDVFGGGVK